MSYLARLEASIERVAAKTNLLPSVVRACMTAHADSTVLLSAAEIRFLPNESVIRTPQGYTMEKLADGWYRAGVQSAYEPNPHWTPAELLFRPAE
jgi:S-ribosylhomocysteine lyase LuxS involved in autoinducer biosynthesis